MAFLPTVLRYSAFCAVLVGIRGFGLASYAGVRYPIPSFFLDTAALLLLMGACHALYFALRKLVQACGIKNERQQTGLNFCFVLFGFFPFLLTSIQLHPQKLLPIRTPAAFDVPFEKVELSADGLTIRGWLLNPEGKKPPLLFLHGLNANKDNFLPISAEFARRDFPVLTFDFRAHGESDGRLTTFGMREKDDVAAGVEWIKKRYPDRPIVAVAYSLGGAALLQYSLTDFSFSKVVIDSTFATLKDAAAEKLFAFAGPLKDAAFSIVSVWGFVWTGEDLGALDNRPAIARLDPQKVMLIHGTADSMISVAQSRMLRAASANKIDLWEIEGANHMQTVSNPDYFSRVELFLTAQ